MFKDKKGSWVPFCSGLAFGTLLISLILAGYFWRVSSKGMAVTLAGDEVAHYISQQVERQAAQELPQIISQLKGQVPQFVKEQMQAGSMTAEIKISNINITLPPEALNQLNGYLQGTVETTVFRLLDGIDLNVFAADLGQQAGAMVKETLDEELGKGQILQIKTKWGTIPVNLEVDSSGKDGKDY